MDDESSETKRGGGEGVVTMQVNKFHMVPNIYTKLCKYTKP
jgi:hypothetical protein